MYLIRAEDRVMMRRRCSYELRYATLKAQPRSARHSTSMPLADRDKEIFMVNLRQVRLLILQKSLPRDVVSALRHDYLANKCCSFGIMQDGN